MKKILILLPLFIFTKNIIAQNVGIGTVTPNASAMLDVSSGNKGLLIPQVALTGVNDVTTIPAAANSLMIYNRATAGIGNAAVTPGFYYWENLTSSWIKFGATNNSTAWLLTGNANTSALSNFIGTTDNQSLLFKINNLNAGYLGVDGNSYWGYKSGSNSGTGFSNVAIGTAALFQNTNRSNLVAAGDSALYNNGIGATVATDAINNTAIGSKALYLNNVGSYNTALGFNALWQNTSGSFNTATGDNALRVNSTGAQNTANGRGAMFFNTTGSFNTANGSASLGFNTTGNNNTASGNNALFNNTTGYSNVAVGIKALYANTTGSNLVAVGDSALYNNGIGATIVQGKENTAVGSKALISNTIGNGNSAIGTNADVAANNLSNATAIGNKSMVSCSSCMVLGSVNGVNGATSSVKVGIGNTNPLMGLHISKNDSAVALLENTQNLNTDVSNAMYFKTGGGLLPYTGAIKTIGENTGAARLGLFTSAAFSANGLLERLSITDNGNTGIGTTLPLMNLHVSSIDSAVALLENKQLLNTNVSTAMYFKTGSGALPYTGAIKTIGENTSGARIGLFTFASASANSLKERMSILDAGRVGIGITTPQTFVHINPAGAGALLIGTNKSAGGYTNIEMGISAQSNGYGYIQTTKSSGSSYGNLALNESGGGVGVGTSQVDPLAKLTVGVNTGVVGSYSGIVATGNGSTANAGIKAIGTNNADALVIDGPIRALTNNSRVIYRMTTQTVLPNTDGYLFTNTGGGSNTPDAFLTVLIDNPLCNGDPNAMIFYSLVSGYAPANKNYQSYLLYLTASQKWSIKYYYDIYSGANIVNALEFNIMIVKP